jgi:hypothetical protein
MPKDRRYATIKPLIEAKGITTFDQIFLYIPRKVLYTDMGLNYARFKRMADSPDLFTLRDFRTLGDLFGVDGRIIIDLASAQVERDKRKKK